eukprot:TRINITY_DN372_c0_g1_i5.p1 TRINITY_DN372_c0_g1~~TRINITY_DN372_c0_g1_i5.p1  ORF type:complete len:510 (-),score=144.37 TRINITY_DN372_c0_g1_i5:175-1704(-)
MASLKTFTREEVAKHNTKGDLWIIIDDEVYDMTKFITVHPGGEQALIDYAGQDATDAFYGLHRQEVLVKYLRFKIGKIEGGEQKIPIRAPGEISTVPYAEASFWMGHKSPYYNESHLQFRQKFREFYHLHVLPEAQTSEESGKAPSAELFKKAGAAGILAALIGPGPWLKGMNILGVPGEKFDYFHEQIAHEESCRMGYPSFQDGICAGLMIGLPPVLNFGPAGLRDKIAREVFAGEKRICLAITEPYAGSDVANIKCTAERTPDGKFFIVNGCKKWITNGTACDYFATAVRTDKGITMLLIERSEGLETEPIKTSYSACAGTAYITYTNVKVPVENILGKDGRGFQVIMYNFNHERWAIIGALVGACRYVLEESMKWANQRQVFNKKLLAQPVIRFKLAKMVGEIEAVQNWLENITYQMTKMTYAEQSVALAGPIALLKFVCTRMATEVSDESCQIFGGRAITKTGMGRVIEAWQRTFKYGSILGGSEEIMADLGIKQALRNMPNSKL